MPITLAQSALYSNNQLVKGVIQTQYTYSDLLRFLPFKPVKGAAYVFNRETAAGGAAVYAPGDTWAEGTATVGQVSVIPKIIGGDAEIDEFAANTRNDTNDLAAEQITLKARDVAQQFEQLFITGDSGGNAKQFDGLRVLATLGNGNRVGCSGGAANGATLTLDDLDTLIDTVKAPVHVLIMSQRSKRKLKALFRASGASMEQRDVFGDPIDYYGKIPICTNNFIVDTLTKGTSTDTSEIYAVSFDAAVGVTGLQAEATGEYVERPDTGKIWLPGPQVIPIGQMETKDAQKYRVRWYTAIAAHSLRGFACLDGCRP